MLETCFGRIIFYNENSFSSGEAARKTIHSQLMEVYNYITDQLNSKEKDLNREVETKMNKICEKADLTRDKLKELSNNIVKVSANEQVLQNI